MKRVLEAIEQTILCMVIAALGAFIGICIYAGNIPLSAMAEKLEDKQTDASSHEQDRELASPPSVVVVGSADSQDWASTVIEVAYSSHLDWENAEKPMEDVANEIRKLPANILWELAESRTPIVIGTSKLDIEIGAAAETLYFDDRVAIVISDDSMDVIPQAALHEVGHWYDYDHENLSDTSEFCYVYGCDRDEYRRSVYYGYYSDEGMDRCECFASIFATYFYSEDSRATLKENCPKMYRYIQALTN